MKKVIKSAMATILVSFVFIGIYFVFFRDDVRLQTKAKVDEEVKVIRSTENSDKVAMIDIDDAPYFLKEQLGFEYKSADTFSYYSNVVGKKREAKVLLPANYSNEKKYNLLIVLHGLNGTLNTWINKDADTIVQNVQYFENMPETIVVFADSNLNAEGDLSKLDFLDTVKYFDLTEKDVMESLLPQLEKSYGIKSERKSRAIAGHSLGGRNALYIAFKNPQSFAYVGAFGPARVIGHMDEQFSGLLDTVKQDENDKFKLIMITYGEDDELVADSVAEVRYAFEKENVYYVYYETDGGHNDRVWQPSFYNFVRRIFK